MGYRRRPTSDAPAYWESNYRMAHSAHSPERLAAWRAKIPFSDEAIAQALEKASNDMPTPFMRDRFLRMAATARRGRVSTVLYTAALSYLVKVCAICGKTAHYRLGAVGRCRQHRDITTAGMALAATRHAQKAEAIDAAKNERDKLPAPLRYQPRQFDAKRKSRVTL